MIKSPAQRAYTRRMLVLMTSYILILLTVVTLFNRDMLSGPVAYAAGLLPALPIIGVFWAMARLLVEETDEYMRMLFVRQILVATGFALSLCTLWGFLEEFDLVDHIASYWAAVLWFLGLGIGGVVNKLTLGNWGLVK